MESRWDSPFWIGDRFFNLDDIAEIQSMAKQFRRVARRRLAAIVCERLAWQSPAGTLRVDSCVNLLNAMEASGLIRLKARPPSRRGPQSAQAERRGEPISPLQISASLSDVKPIRLVPFVDERERLIWNATIAAYHPLGYQRAFGARQHYWIVSDAGSTPVRLGGLLFGSSAKALAARDQWIGWDNVTRGQFRSRIVNNSRYLILPGVHVPHLASHVLGLLARRIRRDWQARYGFAPVLLETFVERPYRGTCYAASQLGASR